MIEDVERGIGEKLARSTTRNQFLGRLMGWSFGTVAGLAAAGAMAQRGGAHTLNGQAHCANTSGNLVCNPPNGQYCPNCNFHECGSGYHWTSAYGYPSACWCTAISGGKYWICCDCASNDGNTSKDCACAQCVGSGCPQRPTQAPI